MEKKLNLYTYVDGGVNDTPFPNSESPIEIGVFRYDAQRMGGAPVITASVSYHDCLDDVWTDKVYAEFNGEKYYLKQTPTSSYSNEDQRYKHEIELISERVILDNVYFYDSVKKGETQPDDKPLSNSTKFTFFGDISEFANRLSSSLRYSRVDYDVVVDDGIVSDEKLLTFEDQFFSNVIQESYNTYEIPYYFVGKTIHFGYSDDVVMPTFEYGVDNSLISISKNNLGFKTVNRATGRGSSDNIPFYYPNNSPKGDIDVECSNRELSVKILDYEKFGNEIDIDSSITFRNSDCELTSVSGTHNNFKNLDEWFQEGFNDSIEDIDLKLRINATSIGRKRIRFKVEAKNIRDIKDNAISGASYGSKWSLMTSTYGTPIESWMAREATTVVDIEKTGDNTVYLRNTLRFVTADGSPVGDTLHRADIKISISLEDSEGWEYDGKMYDIEDFGLYIASGKPVSGDTITQKLIKYVNTAENLMPSIYRETDGDERFYNAVNGEYVDVNGRPITFVNTFSPGNPIEQVVSFDDIKPTIKESTNSISWTEKDENGDDIIVFQRVDMFSEFAYDNKDSDETYEDEEDNLDIKFKHSYFFAKLRKLPFNLFEHAIEGEPMTISFTSGDCGACKFTIGVTEGYPQKNPVQVNPDGTLKRDSEGRVICGVNSPISDSDIQETQQDTINNEVWIALRKEEETYGILMPKAPDYDDNGNQINNGHRPKACSGKNANDGDSFVILGIHLPQEYILSAEEKLKNEIIKYMQENNEEKFSFSIDFSRIYFEENQDILQSLNENSRISIRYNDKTYVLYVSSFSYEMSEGELLPKISVELDESLTIGQNALQNAISEVKSEIGKALSNIDFLALTNPFFIRKDTDDEARGKINFTKGIKFGEGGKVEVMDNNSAKLTIEYLEVTKKASFTSLEIQEKTHVGGQILVTPAAINCGEIEELDDAYRCYFQTKGTDGDEIIFNQFAVGDQAICQTYNAWGSKYYWRLVAGIGKDYIDLSKTECDEDSGIPSAGDKIVQLGNRTDVERQNAIVIAAYGDGSPYIIQYKGINSFEIGDDKIVTKLSSTENIFTGKVHMEMGSDGVENLNLEIGGQNLLRNSGFTGDYLSEQLADDKVLEAASELYSSPLDHWQDAGNINIVDSTRTTSGKEVELDGVLSQNLFYKTELGSNYVLSFMAKGEGSIVWTLGTQKTTIELGAEWAKYESTIEATSSSVIFIIEGQGEVIIGDLKLEKGNVATSWSASPLDNASDRAYYQSMKYIQNAFEGATDVSGGLVLTEQIQVGDYDSENKKWVKMNGGVSGAYESDQDVAFWAGGNFTQAINAVMKYDNDPTYQPTQEELANMANFVVTHGGRAILNDAIIRGTIYAKDGDFTGTIHAKDGEFTGKIESTDGHIGGFQISGNRIGIDQGGTNNGMFLYDRFIGFRESGSSYNSFTAVGENVISATSGTIGLARFELDGSKDSFNQYTAGYGLMVDVKGYGNPYAFYCTNGVFAGLRYNTTVIKNTSKYTLTKYDHTIVIDVASGTGQIELPKNPEQGQRYEIYTTVDSMDLKVYMNGQHEMYNLIDGVKFAANEAETYTADKRRHITIFFAGGIWLSDYRYLEKK